MSKPAADRTAHTKPEDILAILTGTLVISFGVMLMKQSGTLTGGTAGLALLVHHGIGVPFGVVFLLLNLPFAYIAYKQMGAGFLIRTFLAIVLVSFFTEFHGRFIEIGALNPFYAAVLGGVCMGLGFLVLFRHRTSLGGFNILALYLQNRFGIRAGNVQMALDLIILVGSAFLISPPLLVASIIGAAILNLILTMNHRPDRYIA